MRDFCFACRKLKSTQDMVKDPETNTRYCFKCWHVLEASERDYWAHSATAQLKKKEAKQWI